MAPARGGVNPLLVLAGVVLIAAIAGVGIYAYSNSSKGSPGPSSAASGGSNGPTSAPSHSTPTLSTPTAVAYPGSIVYSPTTFGCNEVVTVTIKLPASVKDTDPITSKIDGVVVGTKTVIEEGLTKQADGSWFVTASGPFPCAIGAGLHTQQLVDPSGKVLAETSFTIAGSSTAKPTVLSRGSVTIEPSTFSCSAAEVPVTQTYRLPASMSGSDEIRMVFDGDVLDPDSVDYWFDQQADGSWLYTYERPSIFMCETYDVGHHTIGVQDAAGNTLAEGSFTINP